jgi:hypothetical protein
MLRSLAASLIILLGSALAFAQEHSRPTITPTPRPTPLIRSTPTPTSSPDPEGWVTFDSAPGRFSVLMPEIPTDKSEVVQSEHGPYTSHIFAVRGDKSIFLIGWVDYDPSFNFNPTLELEANRDNFLKGMQATLLTNQALRLSGYQALEFTAETSDRVFRSRAYMVGRRPYLLVAGTPKSSEDTFNVNRFFDSLKFKAR